MKSFLTGQKTYSFYNLIVPIIFYQQDEASMENERIL